MNIYFKIIVSFLLLFVCIFFSIESQVYAELNIQEKEQLYEAGDALRDYSQLYYIGFGLTVLGTGLFIGALSSENVSAVMLVSSGVCYLSGWICQLIAPSKVGKAGRILQEMALKENDKNLVTNINFGYRPQLNNYNLEYTYHF